MSRENRKAEKEELRERILNVSARLFFSRGIRQMKMNDLASELSVSKKTLYEFFTDKRALLIEVLRHQGKKASKVREEAMSVSDNFMVQLLHYYRKVFCEFGEPVGVQFKEDMQRYPEIKELVEQEKEEYMKSLVAWFHEGVAKGALRDDVDYEIYCRWSPFQLFSVIVSGIVTRYRIEEVYQSIFYVQLRGIATEQGLKDADEAVKQYRKSLKKKQ